MFRRLRGSTGRPCGCWFDGFVSPGRNHSRDRKPAVRSRCRQKKRVGTGSTSAVELHPARATGARHLLHPRLSWERVPWGSETQRTRVRRRPCSSVAGASGKPAPYVVYLIWVTTSRFFTESSRLLRSLRAWLSSRSWTRCGSVRRALSAASACPARLLASGPSATCLSTWRLCVCGGASPLLGSSPRRGIKVYPHNAFSAVGACAAELVPRKGLKVGCPAPPARPRTRSAPQAPGGSPQGRSHASAAWCGRPPCTPASDAAS
jgi:hypothetical protein